MKNKITIQCESILEVNAYSNNLIDISLSCANLAALIEAYEEEIKPILESMGYIKVIIDS